MQSDPLSSGIWSISRHIEEYETLTNAQKQGQPCFIVTDFPGPQG